MTHRTTEWLNGNSHRRYPFVDDSDLSFSGNVIQLPNSVLLDCWLVGLTQRAVGTCSLAEFTVASTKTTFLFEIVTVDEDVLQLELDVPRYSTNPFVINGATDDLVYTFVFGDITVLEGLPQQTFVMTHTPVIQPALHIAQDRHRVDSVRALGGGSSATLTGALMVEPGYNCGVVVTKQAVRLIAGVGLGAGKYCESLGAVPCSEALSWFNSQNANNAGNIGIMAGPGVSVTADQEHNTVVIKAADHINDQGCSK